MNNLRLIGHLVAAAITIAITTTGASAQSQHTAETYQNLRQRYDDRLVDTRPVNRRIVRNVNRSSDNTSELAIAGIVGVVADVLMNSQRARFNRHLPNRIDPFLRFRPNSPSRRFCIREQVVRRDILGIPRVAYRYRCNH